MRIGGMGNGTNTSMQANVQSSLQSNMSANRHVETHQVTDCIHKHDSELIGGVRVTIGAGQTVQPTNVTATETPQNGFSLTSWLSDSFKNVKNALNGFWNGGSEKEGATGERSDSGVVGNMDSSAVTLEKSIPSTVVAAAATNVQATQDLENNPYFSAISDTGRQSETLWQRVKVKFNSVAGHLMKRFSFSGRNSFQTKQEQPKEDMRRRSHYKDDDLEMDCVLTDDSYLMDSYDRKGEYRKLSAKK